MLAVVGGSLLWAGSLVGVADWWAWCTFGVVVATGTPERRQLTT